MTNGDYLANRGSVLKTLRNLVPSRPTSIQETMRRAELQAARLLELLGVDEGPVPDDVVLALPRIERRFTQLRAASGMTFWSGRSWVIGINETEPLVRQRFTLFHEFKHIIDHGRADELYRGNRYMSGERQAERAADYFAACALMPKRLVLKAWYRGMQRTRDLARHFEVSEQAIEFRLSQLGLRTDVFVQYRPGGRSRLPARPSRSQYFRVMPTVPTTAEVTPCPS